MATGDKDGGQRQGSDPSCVNGGLRGHEWISHRPNRGSEQVQNCSRHANKALTGANLATGVANQAFDLANTVHVEAQERDKEKTQGNMGKRLHCIYRNKITIRGKRNGNQRNLSPLVQTHNSNAEAAITKSTDFLDELRDGYDKAIVWDFNINLLTDSKDSDVLTKALADRGFGQIINKPVIITNISDHSVTLTSFHKVQVDF